MKSLPIGINQSFLEFLYNKRWDFHKQLAKVCVIPALQKLRLEGREITANQPVLEKKKASRVLLRSLKHIPQEFFDFPGKSRLFSSAHTGYTGSLEYWAITLPEVQLQP